MTSKTARYVPPLSQEQLVLAWLRRARESQMAHYEMADLLTSKGRYLGVPVIVLTSLVGTSLLGSVAAEVIPTWSKILVGLLSIAAAVLSSLQTFFNYSDRAEKHRASGARYGAVRRKLENVFAGGTESVDQRLIDELREQLDTLAQESLHVPADVFERVQNRNLFVGDGRSDSEEHSSGEAQGPRVSESPPDNIA